MRLIDADKLKQDHFMSNECETCINDVGRCQNWHSYTKMDFCGWIDDAPTVDAVAVVRCKDCIHYWNRNGVCDAHIDLIDVDDDCYCSWGEKR